MSALDKKFLKLDLIGIVLCLNSFTNLDVIILHYFLKFSKVMLNISLYIWAARFLGASVSDIS